MTEDLLEIYQSLPRFSFGPIIELKEDGCPSDGGDECTCSVKYVPGSTWSGIMSQTELEVESSETWKHLLRDLQNGVYSPRRRL